MAATVESAFVLIDRASGPIRRIRRELKETRLEAERTGRALDDLSGPRSARQLDQTAREMGLVRRETGKTADEMDRAGNSAGRLERRAAGLRNEVRKGKVEWSALGKALSLLKWPALIAGIGGATQAVGGLTAGVVGLLPRLLDLSGAGAALGVTMVGAGAAMGVVKLATHGLSQALNGNKKALQGLTPEGRAFVQVLRGMHPEIARLQATAQRGLFPGLTSFLGDLRAQAPEIRGIVRQTSGDLGGLARFGGKQLAAPGFMRDLAQLSDEGARALGSAARSGVYFGRAIEQVLLAAAPFTDWLGHDIERLARFTEQEALAARESGRLGRFLDNTKKSITTMADIGRHAFGGLMGLMHAASGESDSLWTSIDRGARRWDEWSNSIRGQDSMRRWFADMRPTIHEAVGLIGDLAKTVGDLSRGPEGAQMLHALREALPSIAGGVKTLTASLGPAVVTSLGDVVQLLADASGNAGPLTLLARSVGFLAHDLDLLVNALGPAGPALATFLSTMLLMKKMNLLSLAGGGLLGARGGRGARAAAGVGAAEGVAAGAGAVGLGSLLKGMGRSAVKGGPSFIAGPAGGAVETAAVGGGLRAIGGAGLRAVGGAVGRFLPPVAVASGLLGALGTSPTQGGWAGAGQRAVGFGDAASFGLAPALRHAVGIGKYYGWSGAQFDNAGFKGVGQSVWGALNKHGGQNPNMRETAQQVSYLARMQRMYANETTAGGQRIYAAITRELGARRDLLRTMRQQKDEASVRHGVSLGSDDQKAFSIRAKHDGPEAAMKHTVDAVLREQSHMRPAGAKQLDDTMLDWARTMAKHNPALLGEVQRLERGIKNSFSSVGKHVQIVNGQVLQGTKTEWKQIRLALTTQTEKAREDASKDFTAIQQQAVGSLMAMGFSQADAHKLVQGIENGGQQGKVAQNDVAMGAIPTGTPGKSQTYSENSKNLAAAHGQRAYGGRVAGYRLPGSNTLQDSVPMSDGGFGAPGELVINRHTEARVRREHGVDLGREVANEMRAHSAPMYAKGGRVGAIGAGLHAGVAKAVSSLLGQFPGLSITSTTGGKHAGNSFHYRGEAADIGGPAALMYRAAEWIKSSGLASKLTEGIHNPNLSIKQGHEVSPGFWGKTVWGQHANHIHMAVAGALGAFSGGGPGALGGLGQIAALVSPHSRVRGLPGAAANAAGGLYAAGLTKRINQKLGSMAGGGMPGSGGSNTANMKLGRAMMLAQGWGGGEWPSLKALWTRESGWNANAVNPSSGAYGIPQALGHGHPFNLGDARAQIGWGLNYIRGRYGSPSAAWGHEQHAGWYGKGGDFVVNKPTVFGAGERGKERVTITPANGSRGVSVHVERGAVVIRGGSGGMSTRRVEQIVTRKLEEFAEAVHSEITDGREESEDNLL